MVSYSAPRKQKTTYLVGGVYSVTGASGSNRVVKIGVPPCPPYSILQMWCRCGAIPRLGCSRIFVSSEHKEPNINNVITPRNTTLKKAFVRTTSRPSSNSLLVKTHILIVKLLDQLLTVSSLTCGFKRAPPVYGPKSPIPTAP